MDINICVDELNLNLNTYRLTQSPPPHKIIEWLGPDPEPTETELKTAWESYLSSKAEQEAVEPTVAENV
jgi:hypothetical protein